MNIHMGEKIRQLRKEKNISQEVLAQVLGVSFQAVSKWETGAAFPDITLIPAIAAFFGVSTDDLFQYNRLAMEEKITALCMEAAELRVREPEKAEKMLREGLKQYPGNDIILNNLLYTLEVPQRSEEVITICKSLIAATHDDSVKYDAVRILADTYHQTGQQDLVEPTLELIPEIYFTKLEQMAFLLEGEKSRNAARQHLALCFHQMAHMLLILRSHCLEDGSDGEKYGHMVRRLLELFQESVPEFFQEGSLFADAVETVRQAL